MQPVQVKQIFQPSVTSQKPVVSPPQVLPVNNQVNPAQTQTHAPSSMTPRVVPKPVVNYSKPYQEQKNIGYSSNFDSNKNQSSNKLSILDQQDLKDILLEIGRLLLMTQIYKASHPIVQDKLSKLSILMIKIAKKHGRIVLSNREDLMFLNGFQEKASGGPLEKLKETLKFLKVASFEFDNGITEQEIRAFFELVAAQKRAKISGDIKELLKKTGLVHIKPIFLQYVEVEDIPEEVPKPKNVIEGIKHGFRKGGYPEQEQIIVDFLKGEITELPEKVNTFLLKHPKLAAMVIIKLMDEYEAQNLDSFTAFQAYVQSISHYMARLSRLIKDPDQVEQTLRKLEKHLLVRLKSLKKDRKYAFETKNQIKDALSWVQIEQLLAHYEEAKENLNEKEQEIVDAIEKRKVPSVRELEEKIKQQGMFESKLTKYFNEVSKNNPAPA